MKTITRVMLCAFLFIGMVTVLPRLLAQSTTGSVYGNVTDPTGASIPGVNVTLKDVHTGITQVTTTNGSGDYTFATVNPGDFVVTSSATGFKSETQTGVTVASNQNVHVTFSLTAGAVSETVEVAAGTTFVDTRESQLGETIDENRLENLPTLNRSTYDLVAVTPGVSSYTADTLTGSRNGASFSVNGLPTDTVGYYLDGSYNNAFKMGGGSAVPNPDALQEFRLITSNFDAEFGRSPGAVANFITKSGGGHYHGTAYDYIRNTMFNARNYFLFGGAVTPLHQNQFGGDLGGPIPVIRQSFFFLDYQGLILHTPATVNSTLVTATALERTGNFTASTASVQSGITKAGGFKNAAGGACPNPLIVCQTLDPVAVRLLAYVPTYIPGLGTPIQVSPANVSANQGTGRIDYNGIHNHSIEGMFFNTRGTTTDPLAGGNQIVGYSGMTEYENQANAVLVDTQAISERTVNTARGFYAQNTYIISSLYPGQTLASLGSQAGEGGPSYAPPRFGITGYFSAGGTGAGPSNITQSSFGLIDTANLNRGKHSIKVGGSWVRNKYSEDGANVAGGNFTFSGSTTGNAFADFLEGKAQTLAQSNSVHHRTHQDDPALFVQDDWQTTQRLSLNLGLRWEVFEPHTFDPQEGTFVKGQQSTVVPQAPIGFVYQGDKGVPTGLYNTSMRSYAPRVGFAYDLSGTGKTSLRGGYGIFFYAIDQINYGQYQQQPYGLSSTINQTPNLVAPYAPSIDPFPFVVNFSRPFVNGYSGATAIGVQPGGRLLPYVYEYNLTTEQQLSPAFAFSISYVGNAIRKNLIVLDNNSPVYAPNASITTPGLIARRPYEPYGISTSTSSSYYVYGAVNINTPAINGNYNSLQTTLHGRIGNRFNLLTSYVWAKALNYAGPVVDATDIRKNYGAADTDIRNRFVVSYIYHLPDVKLFGLFGKELLSGWQVDGVTTLASGSPFTITSGTDTNRDGTNNDRVDVIGNPYLPKGRSRAATITQYINVSALAIPTGPYGNSRRNQFYGPGNINTNLSLQKEFPIYRQLRFQFRADAFNAFGNVNLNNPRTVLTALTNNQTSVVSGQITGAAAARILQFAGRLSF